MASSSSGSHASSSGTSTSTFPDFTHDFTIDDFEAPDAGTEQKDQNLESATTLGSAGADTSFDGFFNFGRLDSFELGLGVGQTDLSTFGSFSFGCDFGQQDLGLGLGPVSGVDLAATTFPELGILDLDTPLEVEPLPKRTSSQSATTASQTFFDAPNSCSGDEETQDQRPEDGNTTSQKDSTAAKDSAQPVTYPTRNPLLRLHTPPEIPSKSAPPDISTTTQAEVVASNPSSAPLTSQAQSKRKTKQKPCAGSDSPEILPIGFPSYPIPMDPSGAPDPIVLAAFSFPVPVTDSNPRAGPNRTRNARSRHARTPYTTTIQPKKGKEKALKDKTKAERNVWHVITPPVTAPVQGNPATASGSGTTSAESGSTSGSNSSGRRSGRRKEVFQHVEAPSTEKSEGPKWFVSPPPWKPLLPSPKPRKKLITSDTHSDMGWVLARLREPDCERPQYGWAIAQVHDPRASSYLVLSGPHVTKIKTVRAYDRVAYSPDNIAQLKERCQDGSRGKGPGAKGEKVYDTITHDPAVLARHSSVFGTDQATEGLLSLT